MKCAVMILSTVLLAGCGGIKTVYIPVSSCPAPPIITMPELSINRLPQKPETALALKALMIDHINLKSTLEQCIISLDGYKKE